MVRKKEFRLSEQKICSIAKALTKVTNDDPKDLWLGGTQSPLSKKYPKERSDVDFFIFQKDFDPYKEYDWKKYASKTVKIADKKQPLEKKLGRKIDYTYLPEIIKGELEDLVKVSILKCKIPKS